MLRCEECGKQARTEKEARRWLAYLTVVDEDEPAEVVGYRPDRAKRESEAAVADLGCFGHQHRTALCQQAADPAPGPASGRRPSTAFQCPASVGSSCSFGAYLRIFAIEDREAQQRTELRAERYPNKRIGND
jgi:hypothetical protein